MHMIPNTTGAADDVYSQAQAQVDHLQQSNEYLMMGQQYYNYEAAGRIIQLIFITKIYRVLNKKLTSSLSISPAISLNFCTPIQH